MDIIASQLSVAVDQYRYLPVSADPIHLFQCNISVKRCAGQSLVSVLQLSFSLLRNQSIKPAIDYVSCRCHNDKYVL